MTIKQAQRAACIDTPKGSNGYTLYPATLGLITWLDESRKNPGVNGGALSCSQLQEFCFSFTLPSIEICSLSDTDLKKRIQVFAHSLNAGDFQTIRNHGLNELEKFYKTSVVPKKPMRPKLKQKVKR